MAAWKWESATRRYRDAATGRYMARSTVLSYVEKSIAASSNAAGELARLVGAGGLSPADFGTLARAEIKQEYLREYMLGRGGRAAMTPSDWGTVGQQLRDQYRFFRGFEAEIAAGKLSPEQIKARMDMYVKASREAFNVAHAKNAKDLGMDEEQWILDGGEHCDDCVGFAAEGWQPIGHFPTPGDGSTQCLVNCLCDKTYRNSKTEATY